MVCCFQIKQSCMFVPLRIEITKKRRSIVSNIFFLFSIYSFIYFSLNSSESSFICPITVFYLFSSYEEKNLLNVKNSFKLIRNQLKSLLSSSITTAPILNLNFPFIFQGGIMFMVLI